MNRPQQTDHADYKKEINKRLKSWILTHKARISWIIAAVVIGHILLYVYYYFLGGKSFAYANQKIFDNLVELVVIDLVGVIFTYVYLAYHKIPAEIYIKQKRIIDQQLPEQLALSIERPPTNRLNRIGGKSVRAAFLLIKSRENKKIVELRAIINFEHFYYQPETKKVRQAGYELNAILYWDDDKEPKKEIQLRPDVLKILILSEVVKGQTKDGKSVDIALMHSDPVVSDTTFSRESIYQINIVFQGKLEGEHKFKTYHYTDLIYARPKDQRIFFLDKAIESYNDIPRSLLEKANWFKEWKKEKSG